MIARLWGGWATVNRIVDGDTLEADLDLGLGIWYRKLGIRLVATGSGLNAAEKNTEAGKAARDNLSKIITVGQSYPLTSTTWDKYAQRVDGLVTLPDGSDLGTVLIQSGWAAPWDGKGERPVPVWPRPVD